MTPPTARHLAALALALGALALGGCASVPSTGQTHPHVPTVAYPMTHGTSSERPPAPAPASGAASTPLPAAPRSEAPLRAPSTAPAAGSEARPGGSSLTEPAIARLRPEGEDSSSRTDLWQRVRAGFTMQDLEGELVGRWEQWYSSRPDYVARMMDRGGRYLFHIVEEVDRRGLPSELALLPFIESAFNPQALSVARAAGMWQFMPATGKDFDLRQNLFRDDRRDVLASTRAALDYLQMLHRQFGDWQLALAAYNWGQGNVQRAIERNRRAGLPTDYSSLRMPDETRNYVPKLQAVKNIVARPRDFALALPALENHPFFLSVPIERDIDVALAARLAGLRLEEFRELNPQHNKPVILAAGTPQVLLPYDNANLFVRNVELHRGPLASWTAWVAPSTLRPQEAARQVGMSEADLREVNRIPPRMLVKAGSTLLVPRAAHATANVAEHIADHATIAFAPEARPLRRVAFTVGKKGDTVAAVARRYKVSASQVAQWNDVGVSTRFKPGATVVVMVPQATKKSRTAASNPAPSRRTARAASAQRSTTTRVAQAR